MSNGDVWHLRNDEIDAIIKDNKLMKPKTKWNADLFGVEIQTENMHFVLSANPSFVMSWHDAVRFYKGNKVWQLPTRAHLKLIAERIDDVNARIEANGGYKIRGLHWTADEYDKSCAWPVSMNNDNTDYYNKYYNGYVRAVSVLSI